MAKDQCCVNSLVVVVSLIGLSSAYDASAADNDPAIVKVAGIMVDFDLKANWITVKADGENQPIKYLVPAENKLTDVLGESVFPASRVQLTYKQDGDSRRLVSIKKQVLRGAGTVTGVVVKVHNDFWVELKPKGGLADAYAPGAKYNDKVFMGGLKALQPGDSVTIKFYTDFERHRIEELRKNEAKAQPT